MSANTAIRVENIEATSNITGLKIPRMVSIQALVDESGFSYKTLWKMCKENKIVHVKAGNKYLINVDKFVDFLNAGEQE